MRGTLYFLLLTLFCASCLGQVSNYGPLPDAVQFTVVLLDNLDPQTAKVGDIVVLQMPGNMRGPGGVVVLPKDAKLYGRLELIEIPSGAFPLRFRLKVSRAEWEHGSLALNAFAVAIALPEVQHVKLANVPLRIGTMAELSRSHHAEKAPASAAIDIVMSKPFAVPRTWRIMLRQTTRTDFTLSLPTEPVPTGTVIYARLKNDFDIRTCKAGQIVEFELASAVKAGDGSVVIPQDARLTGSTTECNAHTTSEPNSKVAFTITRADWKKDSLPLRLALHDLAREPVSTQQMLIRPGALNAPYPPGFGPPTEQPYKDIEVIEPESASAPNTLVLAGRDILFEARTLFTFKQK